MEFINTLNIKLLTNQKISCIYMIQNMVNNKLYIGQTTDFRKRLSDYKNYHKKKAITSTQPIKRAIRAY